MSLLDLPADVWANFFTHVAFSIVDLVSISRTCRSFHKIVNTTDELWRLVAKHDCALAGVDPLTSAGCFRAEVARIFTIWHETQLQIDELLPQIAHLIPLGATGSSDSTYVPASFESLQEIEKEHNFKIPEYLRYFTVTLRFSVNDWVKYGSLLKIYWIWSDVFIMDVYVGPDESKFCHCKWNRLQSDVDYFPSILDMFHYIAGSTQSKPLRVCAEFPPRWQEVNIESLLHKWIKRPQQKEGNEQGDIEASADKQQTKIPARAKLKPLCRLGSISAIPLLNSPELKALAFYWAAKAGQVSLARKLFQKKIVGFQYFSALRGLLCLIVSSDSAANALALEIFRTTRIPEECSAVILVEAARRGSLDLINLVSQSSQSPPQNRWICHAIGVAILTNRLHLVPALSKIIPAQNTDSNKFKTKTIMDAISLLPRTRRAEAVIVVAKHLKQHHDLHPFYLRPFLFDQDINTLKVLIEHFSVDPEAVLPRIMFNLLADRRCVPASIQQVIDSAGGDARLVFSICLKNSRSESGGWPVVCHNLEAYVRVFDPPFKQVIAETLSCINTAPNFACALPLLHLGVPASPLIRAALKKNFLDCLPSLLEFVNVNAVLDESNGDNLLHTACRLPDSRVFLICFSRDGPGDVKSTNHCGNTALHLLFAAQLRQPFWTDIADCVRTLITRGADMYQTNSRGQTPLDLLLSCPNADIIAAVQSCGIRVDTSDFKSRFVKALELAQAEIALKILEFDPSVLDPSYRTSSGDSILHLAVRADSLELSTRVFAAAPTLANSISAKGWTPLHLAMNSYGSERIDSARQARLCREFLFGGAKLDLEETSCHPLSIAALNLSPDLLLLITEWHAQFPSCELSSQKHAKEYSQLLVSTLELRLLSNRQVSTELVSALIQLPKVDLNARSSTSGATPLILAAQSCPDAVPLLLEAGISASVNYYDDYGLTALMYACWKGSEACLSALISAGADVHASCKPSSRSIFPSELYRTDYFTGGQPIIFYAFFHKNFAAVKLLLAAGVDLGIRDASGRWLGDFAVDIWNSENDDWGQYQNFLTELMTAGVSWYLSSSSCALYRVSAAILGSRSLRCRLLHQLLTGNLQSCYLAGRNIFLFAAPFEGMLTQDCIKRHSQIIAPSINDIDEKGMSILHYACQNCREQGVLSLLVSLGANPLLRNLEGHTPLHRLGMNSDPPHDLPQFLKLVMQKKVLKSLDIWSEPAVSAAIPLTPLMVACQHASSKIIECFLDSDKVDPSVEDKAGKAALDYFFESPEANRYSGTTLALRLGNKLKRLPSDTLARLSVTISEVSNIGRLVKLGADPTVTRKYQNNLITRIVKKNRYGLDLFDIVSTCSLFSLANEESYSGETPLLASILERFEEDPLRPFRSLLMMKVNPNKANRFGDFPLLRACQNTSQGAVIATELLKAGARPDTKVPARLSLLGTSETWLIHCIRWAQWDPLPILQYLESLGVKLAGIVSNLSNLLHLAASAQSDRSSTIAYLVSCGVDINALDKRGMSPLQIAMESPYGPFDGVNVKSLLQHGSNPDLLSESCFDPETSHHLIGAHPLLTRAALRLFEHSAKRDFIFNTAHAGARDAYAQRRCFTPLIWAVKHEIFESVEILLSHDWINVNCPGLFGKTSDITALMQCQDESIFKLLLSSPKIDIFARNSEGADIFRVMGGKPGFLQQLLQHPAAKDATGLLHSNLQAEHIISYTSSESDPVFQNFVFVANRKHLNEALLLAVTRNTQNFCKSMINYGADMHYVNAYNENVLCCAAKGSDMLSFALRRGVKSVGLSSQTGLSPIGHAATKNNVLALIALLKNADFNPNDLRSEVTKLWDSLQPLTKIVFVDYFGLQIPIPLPQAQVSPSKQKNEGSRKWTDLEKLPVPSGYSSHYAYCLLNGNLYTLRDAIKSAKTPSEREMLLNGIHETEKGGLTTLHAFVNSVSQRRVAASHSVLRWLLQQPDLNFNQASDCYGHKGVTAWHLAVLNGSAEAVQLFLCTPLIDILAVDAMGRDALSMAQGDPSSRFIVRILRAHSSFANRMDVS